MHRGVKNKTSNQSLDVGQCNNINRILIVDDCFYNITAIKVILELSLKLKNVDVICNHALNGKLAVDEVKKNVD